MHPRTQEGIGRRVLQDRPAEDFPCTRLPTALFSLPVLILTASALAQDHQDQEILQGREIALAGETIAIKLISEAEGKSDLLLKLDVKTGE